MRQTVNLNITLFQGADFNPIILVPASVTNCVPVPLNITGYTFTGMVRSSTDLTLPPVATFTFTVLDQTLYTGQVQWFLSAANIDAIVASLAEGEDPTRLTTPYLYDVYMLDTLSISTRIIQGTAYVSPRATG